ncbi:MAG: LysR family transcriptional regulator [Bdellovibrionaceae bacterium]|nr:LysR family transcriptional regulator [Pseudobdellovibrionaceae bacterium]NUM59802.1 LysR family transcriptional regulator [Pseudobdellovibrionaceae bacterium]
MKDISLNFDLLDPTSCKAFLFSANELNFSKAAEKAGMTQSGISKHISKLEEKFNTELFVRGSKGLSLTPSGILLKKYIEELFERLEKLNGQIYSELTQKSGVVRYAMPESCLMSPHFQIILNRRKELFPQIQLEVLIDTNEKIEKMIIEDYVDFGFLTQITNKLKYIKFCTEDYILVANKEISLSDKKDLLNLSFIQHPDLKNIFTHWKNQYFPNDLIFYSDLNIFNSINDLRGATTFVKNGLENEVTIIPRHCILEELSSKKVFNINPTKNLCINQIHIGHLHKEPSLRVQLVINEFFNILKKMHISDV